MNTLNCGSRPRDVAMIFTKQLHAGSLAARLVLDLAYGIRATGPEDEVLESNPYHMLLT